MQNFGVALLDTEGRLDEDAVLMVAADFSGAQAAITRLEKAKSSQSESD